MSIAVAAESEKEAVHWLAGQTPVTVLLFVIVVGGGAFLWNHVTVGAPLVEKTRIEAFKEISTENNNVHKEIAENFVKALEKNQIALDKLLDRYDRLRSSQKE